jgi:hypothetical protein
MHADRRVVDLTMVKAAFLARENPQRFPLGADGIEAFLRDGERNLFVPLNSDNLSESRETSDRRFCHTP